MWWGNGGLRGEGKGNAAFCHIIIIIIIIIIYYCFTLSVKAITNLDI
jgi:hypothetical protein